MATSKPDNPLAGLPAPSASFAQWMEKVKYNPSLAPKPYLAEAMASWHAGWGNNWTPHPVVDVIVMPKGQSKLSELQHAIQTVLKKPTGKIWLGNSNGMGVPPFIEWVPLGKAAPVEVFYTVDPTYMPYNFATAGKHVVGAFKTKNELPPTMQEVMLTYQKMMKASTPRPTAAPQRTVPPRAPVDLAPIYRRLVELADRYPPVDELPTEVVVDNQKVWFNDVELGEVDLVQIQQDGSNFVIEISLTKAAYAALKAQVSVGLMPGVSALPATITKELP